MGGQGLLGELELVVVLAVLQVGEGAYAVNVRREIERRTGRKVARGTVYVTLDRLARKGLLTSRLGEATQARGGKAKRVFTVLPAGFEAVRASRAFVRAMAEGLDLAGEGS